MCGLDSPYNMLMQHPQVIQLHVLFVHERRRLLWRLSSYKSTASLLMIEATSMLGRWDIDVEESKLLVS